MLARLVVYFVSMCTEALCEVPYLFYIEERLNCFYRFGTILTTKFFALRRLVTMPSSSPDVQLNPKVVSASYIFHMHLRDMI